VSASLAYEIYFPTDYGVCHEKASQQMDDDWIGGFDPFHHSLRIDE
jgi:hypothetical protein